MTELRQSAQEGWTDLATESSYFLKKRGGRHSSPRMLCGPKLGALREVSCPLSGRYGDGVRTQESGKVGGSRVNQGLRAVRPSRLTLNQCPV